MSRLLRGALVVGALAALTVACSPSAGSSSAAPSGPADVSIAARDLAFNPASATVPAGRSFTIAFDNQEAAPHNIQISRDPSFAANQILFTGEIVSSQKINYDVPALDAGTYPFRCEVHPNMLGTFTAQ